jgi:hypothetical protein
VKIRTSVRKIIKELPEILRKEDEVNTAIFKTGF